MYEYTARPRLGVFPWSLSTFMFWDRVFSLNPKLTDSARLASQSVSFGDLPVSTFPLLYGTSMVLQENSIVPGPSCGIWTQVSVLVWQALYWLSNLPKPWAHTLPKKASQRIVPKDNEKTTLGKDWKITLGKDCLSSILDLCRWKWILALYTTQSDVCDSELALSLHIPVSIFWVYNI